MRKNYYRYKKIYTNFYKIIYIYLKREKRNKDIIIK